MFKKQLESDIKLLFGVHKVIFGSVDAAQEQGAMYVDVARCSEVAQFGLYKFRVTAELGIMGTEAGNPYGWLISCLKQGYKTEQTAQAAVRFLVTGLEQDEKFLGLEGYFTKTRLPIVYRLQIPYDPTHTTEGFNTEIIPND